MPLAGGPRFTEHRLALAGGGRREPGGGGRGTSVGSPARCTVVLRLEPQMPVSQFLKRGRGVYQYHPGGGGIVVRAGRRELADREPLLQIGERGGHGCGSRVCRRQQRCGLALRTDRSGEARCRPIEIRVELRTPTAMQGRGRLGGRRPLDVCCRE